MKINWRLFINLLVFFSVSFLLIILIHLLADVVLFGFFDMTESIEEYELSAKRKIQKSCLIVGFFIIGAFLILKRKKMPRLIAVILPALIAITFSSYQYLIYIPIKEFNPYNWQIPKNKFVEARSIVLSNSFNQKEKGDILKLLGSPDNSETDSVFHYSFTNLHYWTLILHFDQCCVTKTELTKEAWNL